MANLKRLSELTKQCKEQNAVLIAVSKTKPDAEILQAYHAGQRVFGENRAQELMAKAERLPKDIAWHMIGHLQRNKVKYIAAHVAMIHSVDSLALAQEIDRQAEKRGRVIPVLLQVHIAEEPSKFGFTPEALRDLLESGQLQKLQNIRIEGLMGMATFTDDMDQVRREFRSLSGLFSELRSNWFSTDAAFDIRSMGMSGDYEVALECGSNMIRVGSAIFGER